MYSFLTRNGQAVAFLVGLAIVVIMFVSIGNGLGDWSVIGEDDPARFTTTRFNFGMYAAIGLAVLAAIAGILFGIYQLVTNPKGALKALLALGVVIGVFFIISASADPNSAMLADLSDFSVNESQSKYITGGIWTAIILVSLAFVSMAISEVINIFR